MTVAAARRITIKKMKPLVCLHTFTNISQQSVQHDFIRRISQYSCKNSMTLLSFSMTFAVFHDFPRLENGPPKFHDFPGPVGTLCFLGSMQHTKWHLSCFCTVYGSESLYFTMGRPFPPQNYRLLGRIWTHI